LVSEHRPEVLFVCVHNAGRSQMAAGLLRKLAGDRVAVRTAGSEPADELNPVAVEAMREIGVDLSQEFPKPLTDEFVRDADVVITMLATGGAVQEVLVGQDVLGAIRPNGIWAQMGTIGVDATESLAGEVGARRPDVAFVDAPVTGTRGPARNGQLTILASGPDRARATVEPVFAELGQRVLWLGPAGQGSRMKLVLNTWLAFEVEAAAEVSATAARLAIPYSSLREAAEGTPLASGAALARMDQMQKGDHSPSFPLEWALKDLDLVAAAAGTQAVPVVGAIADRWRRLVGEGYGRLDVSAARLGLTEEPVAVANSQEVNG
jgi:3-hydroxyisobutyrate dehydrogenase